MSQKIIRLPAVLDKTGLSRSSLYRLIAEGKFPRQVKLSERSAGWFEHSVNQWLSERISNRTEAAR